MSLPSFSSSGSVQRVLPGPRRIWQMRSRPAVHIRRRILIVGSGKSSRSVAQYLEQDRCPDYFVCGFLADGTPPGNGIIGGIQDLTRVALAEFVDEVILAAPCDPDLVRRVLNQARRLRLAVRVVPDLFGLDPKLVGSERLGDVPVLKLHSPPVPMLGLFLKRAIDLSVSAVALAIMLPLFIAIAGLVVTASGFPVFYRARRIGRKGKGFLCYKFRTMVADADSQKARLRGHNERQGPVFKMANDPRVTGVGRWLRRYSLDELPQLWNVLRGDMSLVGPRPHPVDDFERYDPEHLRRLQVKLGITGLWQVMARNDPSFQRNMALDLEYIERWNLWLDLRILCRTTATIVQGSGT